MLAFASKGNLISKIHLDRQLFSLIGNIYHRLSIVWRAYVCYDITSAMQFKSKIPKWEYNNYTAPHARWSFRKMYAGTIHPNMITRVL